MGQVVDLGGFSDPERKRQEAEAFRRLGSSTEFRLFQAYLDQAASKYLQQLLNPSNQPNAMYYLQGLIKGLDVAKELPQSVLGMYDTEVKQELSQPANPTDPSLRESPIPEEDGSA